MIETNNIKTIRFSGKAENYFSARPGYAPEIDKIFNYLNLNKQSVVADIGAGTGIFSKILLDKGYTVYSIEPNFDMRSKAQQTLMRYPKSVIVDATAEETTLPDKSIDLVTAAQSFHWFSPCEFKRECMRILKDEGNILLIWNVLNNKSKIVQLVEKCMHSLNREFHGVNAGIRLPDIHLCIPNAKQASYTYNIRYNKDIFRKRWLSSSFSPCSNSREYQIFTTKIDEIFDEYSVNGTLTVENQTTIYVGTPFG